MFVDAYFDREKNKILVSEVMDGKTILKEYSPELFFYTNDERGRHVSIYGDKVTRHEYSSFKAFASDLKKYRNRGEPTYEGNVRPVFKTLERWYHTQKSETLNISYYDIEVDWSEEKGYAPTDNPFNRVTAISVYNSWEETLYSLSLHPRGMTYEEAEKELEGIPNNIICNSEEELFMVFFELIKDSQVIAGWNSAHFDLVYMVNRIPLIMDKSYVTKFCLWGLTPSKRTAVKFGKEEQVYDTHGRVHLDMLELYQKYTYQEQPSYRLDYIGELEIKENKVPYEGTLDKLYNEDYRKFIEYSRQDAHMLKKINDKKKHIELAFTIAHQNMVDVKTVMGAVALSDNAIVLEAHRRGMVVRDSENREGDSRIAGAWVADPKTGIHENVASCDLNSLYPSIFRSLNLGNETVLGQVQHTITEPLIHQRMLTVKKNKGDSEAEFDEKKFAEAWYGIFLIPEVEHILEKDDTLLKVKFEDGDIVDLTAKEIYEFVFDNGLIITANGTIIRTDKQSIIASLLERWYNERKQFQARAAVYTQLIDGLVLPKELL